MNSATAICSATGLGQSLQLRATTIAGRSQANTTTNPNRNAGSMLLENGPT